VCGIGGCVAPAGSAPDVEALGRLAASLAHRGPDGGGIEVDGSVGLVNTRLAVLAPGPAGAQPMADPETGWRLTYNGEVFNHRELRGELGDRPFRGASDTETALRALEAWGARALPRFVGQFALAALDPGSRRLLLARDRFGIKPLYWARHAGGLWFASEVGALLSAGIPRVADRETLAKTLSFGWAGGERTAVEGIRSLMPGTLMEVDLDTLQVSEQRWYDPCEEVDAELQADLAARPRSELRAMLEAELQAATQRALLADAPLGAFCSGGVDSGLITAMASQHAELVALVASMRGPGVVDEARYAELVAQAAGVDLDVVEVTADVWRGAFVAAVRHHDRPLPNATPVAVSQLSAAARRRGIKAVLVGEGADELFGGYRARHAATYRRALTARRRAAFAISAVGDEGLPAVGRAIGHRLPGRRPKSPPPVSFGGATGFEDRIHMGARSAYGDPSDPRRELAGSFLADLSLTLPHLLHRMDASAMQNAVEARLPFLDPKVVRLALNLPLEARVLPRQKGVLGELALQRLPRAAIRRPKVGGMMVDCGRWLAEASRPEFLGDGALREILEIPGAAWRAQVRAAPDSQAITLWSAEAWCRIALHDASDEDVERALWC
jgi:asparagine synthase (glutamine-hydrolysing)